MSENLLTPDISGSIVEQFGLRSPVDTSMKGDERVIAVLAKKVDDLAKELYEVKKEKLLKETHLPLEVLEHLGLPPNPPTPLKRGRGYRPPRRDAGRRNRRYDSQRRFAGEFTRDRDRRTDDFTVFSRQ